MSASAPAAVTAAAVKELRRMTGAGMMDCKTALVESGGDLRAAERRLKEQGLAAAAKRTGRAADQGRVFVAVRDGAAALLELSSETDFVARNDTFAELGNALADHVLTHRLQEPDDHVRREIGDAATRIRENIGFKRCAVVAADAAAGEHVAEYVHGEGSIGVLVTLRTGGTVNDQVRATAHDLALHVAAFGPRFLAQTDVDAGYRDEQERIFRTQAEALGKPAKVTEGIVRGKLNKHLSEICLLEQGFVRDEKRKVKQVIAELAKSLGEPVTIAGFRYFKVGEQG